MGIVLLNLITVTFASLFTVNRKKVNYLFFFLSLIPLIIVSGFRYRVGTDFVTYSEIFLFAPETIEFGLKNETGFQLIIKFCKKISDNPQIFFFITSLLINILVGFNLLKNSKYFWLSMYFYITTFTYYATMNGFRQYIASAIIFCALQSIYDGRFRNYLLIVFLAFLVHKSAVTMIPVYFLTRQPIKSKTNKAMIFCLGIAVIFYQRVVDVMFILMPDSTYGNYEETFKSLGEGANILRAVVWAAPIVVCYIYRNKGRSMMKEKYDILFNLCMIGMFFMILATRHKYFARLCIYFDFYYLLMIPLIRDFFKGNKQMVTAALMLCYFAYSTLLLLSGESWIYPLNFNFNLF